MLMLFLRKHIKFLNLLVIFIIFLTLNKHHLDFMINAKFYTIINFIDIQDIFPSKINFSHKLAKNITKQKRILIAPQK